MKTTIRKFFRYGMTAILVFLAAAGTASTAWGQGRPDPAALNTAQKKAMSRFAMMDGIWRGTAWIMMPTGDKHILTQTERVGPFLDGSVRVIEGRGYEEDGSVGFNALGIISFNTKDGTYSMRSYAQGQAGDFIITPDEEGFTWEIPAGPMKIRYRAVFSGDTWKETGQRIGSDGNAVPFYEMTLERVAGTDWPSAGAISRE